MPGVKIVLAAEESAGVQALRAVASSAHRLVAVLTEPRAGSRGVTVAAAAADHGVPVLPAGSVRDPGFAATLRAQDVDVLLNVHSLHLVADEVLAAPRIGCFNLHPGPLPECAGLNAPSWAVHHRRDRHGVTLHWMTTRVDTGAVAYSATFPIGPRGTGLSVFADCVRHGGTLLAQLLTDLEAGPDTVPTVPQELARRRYHGREVPFDGRMPWGLPAARAEAFVRACDFGPFQSPWGVPRARASGLEVGVPRALPTGRAATVGPGTVGSVGTDGALVATADEWLLVPKLRVRDRSVAAADLLRTGADATLPVR